jgi:hypothetical protein
MERILLWQLLWQQLCMQSYNHMQAAQVNSGHDQFMLDSSQWLAEVTPYVPR